MPVHVQLDPRKEGVNACTHMPAAVTSLHALKFVYCNCPQCMRASSSRTQRRLYAPIATSESRDVATSTQCSGPRTAEAGPQAFSAKTFDQGLARSPDLRGGTSHDPPGARQRVATPAAEAAPTNSLQRHHAWRHNRESSHGRALRPAPSRVSLVATAARERLTSASRGNRSREGTSWPMIHGLCWRL